MSNDLAARGIRARDPLTEVGATDDFARPRLAVSFSAPVGDATRVLTLFAYGSNVFAVADGEDFLFVDNEDGDTVRRATCEEVFKGEATRTLSQLTPTISSPTAPGGGPVYSRVHREWSDLDSILVPHLRKGGPVSSTIDPRMSEYVAAARRHQELTDPVVVDIDHRIRCRDGVLMAEYVRGLFL